jgi:hypothetical protein
LYIYKGNAKNVQMEENKEQNNNTSDLKDLLNNKNYILIRDHVDYLLELDCEEFSLKYEYMLVRTYILPIPDENGDFSNIIDYTIAKFLFYLYYKISRAISIIDNYFEHTDEIRKEVSEQMNDTYDDYHFKLNFVNLKIKQSEVNLSLEKIKSSYRKKNVKPILINSKKPNISERYKIANDTLDIYNIINKKNISQTEKHVLLAHILGCSQQVARELFNGTQLKRTPVREKLIDNYLKTIK